MTLRLRWLTSIMLFVSLSVAQAAIVPHLYNAQLPAQTQTPEERQELLKKGLLQVLERITGETQVERHPQVKQALGHASEYVEQYTYQGNEFIVKYSSDMVDHLVHQMGQTVWGQRRPSVVIWLGIEEQAQRRLVGAETDPALQSTVAQMAQKKGLPLTLPLMDLEDVAAVTVTDVWGQFPAVLKQASQRYGAQAILVGRIVHKGDEAGKSWEGNWQLLNEEGSPAWRVEGASLEEVLDQGLTGTTHYLLGHYGVKTPASTNKDEKKFLVGVQNIQSSQDFSQVETYLSSLNGVTQVEVKEVLGETVIFAIMLRGDMATFEQTLLMDRNLIPGVAQMAEPITEKSVERFYRWVPFLAQKS